MYNQILAITYGSYKSFDCVYEVLCVFLDILKTLDMVSYDEALLKLKQNGISGNLCKNLQDFLDNQKQKDSVKRQESLWVTVTAEVDQDPSSVVFYDLY